MAASLAMVAPGTPLRDGIERVLHADRGALVVIGDGPEVLSICTGGFLLDAEFSPQRLSELAKMDGAIIVSSDASRIARANVHLMPSANVPTERQVPGTGPLSALPVRSTCLSSRCPLQ